MDNRGGVGEEPEIYEDDVVCLTSADANSNREPVYGIVLETAWQSVQDDEEQGEESEEEDEDAEGQADGGEKGGNKQNADEEEEEEEDEDDEEEEDRLPTGYVRVAWPDRQEQELPASEVRVVDRSFLHGDVVVSRTDKQGQIGTVIDVQLLVDIRFDAVNGGGPAILLEQVPAASLELPQPYVVGRYVTRGQMLGLVQDCFVDIDVGFGPAPFAPTGVCTVRRPAPSVYKPKLDSKEELHEEDVGHGVYYPGMKVRAKHAQWKRASWIHGSHTAATDANEVGVVLAVRPVELEVDWISGDDHAQMQRGSSKLRPDECTLLGLFEETRWQVGDHCLLARDYKEDQASRIRAEFGPQVEAQAAAAAAAAAGAGADAGASAPAAAPAASKPGKGKKGSAAAAAAAAAAPMNLAHLFSLCGTITRTSTSVRVQWQDGSLTPFVPALEYVARDHLLEDDFMVRDFAVTHAHQRLVQVLAVNARERMVHVRYLSKALRQTEVGPWIAAEPAPAPEQPAADDHIEEGHTEWLPAMDLKTNPAFEFCLGGVVLRVPGHRDDAASRALPADSKLGHAGQVEAIDDQGLIRVLWADRTHSTLEPDQLLIVEHDEDHDHEDEEEWEDDDGEDDEAEGQQLEAVEENELEEEGEEQGDKEEDGEALDSADEESNEDAAAEGAIPAEWSDRNFWRKDGAPSDAAASAAVGSSSVAAAPAASSSSVDAAAAGVSSLSISSSAARPGFSYSSFAVLDAPEEDSDQSTSAQTYRAALTAHKWNATPFAPQKAKPFAKRVRDELKQLASSLPAGVHVRGYEGRMDLFSVLIFGTSETPYFLSLFHFDLTLPADYPASPPVMHFHSRGHRLSPNLYLDGTICLSLLNTWKASHASQRWDPERSTLLQLLVSLQGLVIGAAEPFYLEAGYERLRGQKQACLNSHLYNETALLTSLAHLSSYATAVPPPAGSQGGAVPFGDVVAEHVRSEAVQQQAHELQRLADAWEKQKRQDLAQFAPAPAADAAAATAPAADAEKLDEAQLAGVLARFAIRSGDEIAPAPAAAAASANVDSAAASTAAASAAPAAATTTATSAPLVHYHPSLAFVTMLGRAMRTLIAALDRAAAGAASQQA